MTSLSLGTQTSSPPQSLLAQSCANSTQGQRFDVQHQDIPIEDGAEIQRVKSFSGQYTFKAPAADDFAKGMLSHRSIATPGATVQAAAGTTTGLINALKTFLGLPRTGALASREPD